jgi:cell wall-associated NlpC family hydrolase
LELAQSKLGSPYVRGAKGPNAFDCSGFVYWCLTQAGAPQGYLTSIAWRSCEIYTRIDKKEDLQPGDILVFSGDSETSGHVGIYIGNGEMIDASSGEARVRITNILDNSYWRSHFLMAYRVWL